MRLKIVQHNANGWRPHRIQLSNSYRILDPDIILINDTGLPDGERISLFNYNIYQQNKSGEWHDGCAIAIKKGIAHRHVERNFDNEMLAIIVESDRGDLLVSTGYFAPRHQVFPLEDWTTLANYNIPTLIAGDFNARHRNLSQRGRDHNGAGLVADLLIDRGKLQHAGPFFPTFFGRYATTPDAIFINNKFRYNYHVTEGPVTVSDHVPVIITVSTSPIQIPTRQRFSTKRAKWDDFERELGAVIPTDLHGRTKDAIDVEVARATTLITRAMHNNIPKISYRVIPAPFPTNRILDLQTAFSRIKFNLINGVQIARSAQILRELKLELGNEQLSNYRDFYNNLVTELAAKDPKDFWKGFARMFAKTSKRSLPYVISPTGQKLFKSEETELAFSTLLRNKFRISQEENDTFDEENEVHVRDFLIQNDARTKPNQLIQMDPFPDLGIFMTQVTLEEFNLTLKTFKEKTPGESEITKSILSHCPNNIKQIFVNIFNAAISIGYFPNSLKKANVIMIPKSGVSRSVSDFRPISLLEVHAKVFEKIINTRLQLHLHRNNTLKDSQHGFRAGRGTTTAIAIAHETLARTTACHHQAQVVLRDVKGAFDKVWHSGLQYKLLQLELPPLIEKLICNYLAERCFKVRVGHHLGMVYPIHSGVPQGSILSPSLYNIFVADMPDPIADAHHIIYADDVTQIVTTPWRNPRAIVPRTVAEITQLNSYEKQWKIQTNTNKFKVISIRTRNPRPLTIDNVAQPFSERGTMLGLTITRTGLAAHVSEKVAQAKSRLSKLYRFRQLPSATKKMLYMALVRPILEYPAVPLVNLSATRLLTLQRVQNRAVSFITNRDWRNHESMETLHKQINLLPLNQVIHNRAKGIWRRVESTCPAEFERLSAPLLYARANLNQGWFGRTLQCLYAPTPPPRYT